MKERLKKILNTLGELVLIGFAGVLLFIRMVLLYGILLLVTVLYIPFDVYVLIKEYRDHKDEVDEAGEMITNNEHDEMCDQMIAAAERRKANSDKTISIKLSEISKGNQIKKLSYDKEEEE